VYVGEAIAKVIGKARCLQRIDGGTARIVTQSSQQLGWTRRDPLSRSSEAYLANGTMRAYRTDFDWRNL
jgi:hypothetical protein